MFSTCRHCFREIGKAALICSAVTFLFVPTTAIAQFWSEVLSADGSQVTQRHETGSVAVGTDIYILGGRRTRPVEKFNTTTGTWSIVGPAPVEFHHFQPVVYDNKIYVIGAFTCCFPFEPTIAEIHTFDIATGIWSIAGTIPENRLRGSAGAVVRNDKIYLVGGNTLGHSGGAVPWFDEYNPKTNTWTVLPDAPHARDHFTATLVNNKLVATAGRRSNGNPGDPVPETDIFNFNTGQWETVTSIPTLRSGAMTVAHEGTVYVLGGEILQDLNAYDIVEVYDVDVDRWRSFPPMLTPRHSGAAAIVNGTLHVITGNTLRGGGAETTAHEKLLLEDNDIDTDSDLLSDIDELNIHGTDPSLPDTDNDNLSDYEEIFDHGTNPLDSDSDADGLEDAEELVTHLTDPTNADSDGDNLTDFDEINSHLTNPTMSDSDGDGLSDFDEVNIHLTNPVISDSDGDDLSDFDEVNTHQTNPVISDSDGDNLSDFDEVNIHLTNPAKADSDGDDLSDFDELNIHQTNPTKPDTDADGLSDKIEIEVHFTNPLLTDSDSDGISDHDEIIQHKSDPNNSDTDSDGIADGNEIVNGKLVNNLDEDGDGILNSTEGNFDLDGDGLANFEDLDSDNDGISDMQEAGFSDLNGNGKLDSSEEEQASNLLASKATELVLDSDSDGVADFLDRDSDQDGIPDVLESGAATSTLTGSLELDSDNDSDRNGWHDSIQNQFIITQTDTDTDGISNHLDLDSDNDGIPDRQELGFVDADLDGIVDAFQDTDGDGYQDPVNGAITLADDDGDGIPNYTDNEFKRIGGAGCTYSWQLESTNGLSAPIDPSIPLLGLLALLGTIRSGGRKINCDKATEISNSH